MAHHTIEYPNPPVYVLLYTGTQEYNYTYVETTQVMDSGLNTHETFVTWDELKTRATALGFEVPTQNPFE